MELVQHEKSATCKKCNTGKLQYDRMQHEKGSTWKKSNMTQVTHKKSATRKKCKMTKAQRENKCNMKNIIRVKYIKMSTRIVH